MSGLKIRTEFKNEQLPFSFTTELEGDKLICTIESPKEDQKYACYLLYQKGGNLTAFYKEWYSPNKRREFDLSALLSESDLPAFIAVRVFVGDKDLTIMHSVQSESFYYPLPTGPKVSVVISVHNAEEYLEETFRSVSEQKYLNAEFIFVDMGSKDRSLELLRDFMKSEPRAMLLRERGKFPSNAWDAGMEKASGDYIIFLEAGDTFSPCLLCDTVACAEETCADIVVFSTERFDASKETAPVFEALDPAKTPSDTRAFFGKSGLTDIFAFTGPVLFNKLFRREFLSSHDLLFDPHISMADEVFTYTALALAKKIAPVYKVLLTRRGGGEDETSNDRSLYPLSFLSLPFELKKTLTDKGVYEEIEASFLSFALSYVIRELESARDFDAFKTIYKALKQFGIKELGLLLKPADYYPEGSRKYYGKAEAILKYSEYGYIETFGLDRLISHRLILPPAFMRENKTLPKVTVVVPVYNTEKYLAECLDSILASTMQEFEVICLNDGSTDRSLSIMKEYQKRDSRIVVFDAPKNHGLSITRNVAFDHARGEYICCVDSDDLIMPDHLEKTYEYAKKYDLDMLFFDAIPFYENEELEKRYTSAPKAYTSTVDLSLPRTGKQMLADILKNESYRANMCLQLLKREHLDRRNIRLYPGIIYEDVLFTFVSLLKSESCARLSHPYYKRRYREGSIITEEITGKEHYPHIRSYCIIAAEMMSEMRRTFLSREQEKLFFRVLKWVADTMNRRYKALSESEQTEFTEHYLTPVEAIWFRMAQNLLK